MRAFSTLSPTTAAPTLHACDAYTSLRWLCIAGSQALPRGGAESGFSALLMLYRDLNEARTAELKLNRLRQTGIFLEYLAKFIGFTI
jgi:hypothetical protein